MTLPNRYRDGTFPATTVLGAYTLIYHTEQGATVCAKCASALTSDPVISAETYDEGPAFYCDDCGLPIPSSYGDPFDGIDPEELEGPAPAAGLLVIHHAYPWGTFACGYYVDSDGECVSCGTLNPHAFDHAVDAATLATLKRCAPDYAMDPRD